MAETDTSKAFTFVWKVKNFRMLAACTSLDGEKIKSPMFQADSENKTQWCLVLWHRSLQKMEVKIECCRIPYNTEFYLKSELYVVSGLGDEKLLSKVDCLMEERCEVIGSLETADIMNNHLQNDTLTLRVKLHVRQAKAIGRHSFDSEDEDSDPPYEKEEVPVPAQLPYTCTASSRLKKHRKRVIWTIDMTQLSSRHPGVSLEVNSPYKHMPAFQIAFTAPDQDDNARLEIIVPVTCGKVLMRCTASVMKAEHKYRMREHTSFTRTKNECPLAPFVHLRRLRDEKYFKNTKGVLYLLFDFLFSSMDEMHHIVNCSGLDISLPKPQESPFALEDFARLYETGENADVEIRCNGRIFRVHRLILGARSAVFEAMFRTDMSEAKASSAEIADVDPDTLHRLISFLYSNSVDQLRFVEAMSLYTAADKYQVLPLRCHCSVVLMTLLAADNVCEALRFGNLHQDVDLLDCAGELVRENVDQVLSSQHWMDLMKENAMLAASVMHKLLLDE